MLAALAVVCAPSAIAMDPERAMSQYIRDRWGREQGFPPGSVYGITQTPDGYLWIGTETGLMRFDGWSFRHVTGREGSVHVTGVLGLLPDNEGNLWILVQGPRLLRYRNDLFEDITEGSNYSNITAMCLSTQGTLLAFAADSGAVAFRQDRFVTVVPADKLPRSPIISLAETSDGSIWMGSRDAGLFRFSHGSIASVGDGLKDPKVNCLSPGHSRELWAGTDDGIVRWNGSALEEIQSGGRQQRLQVLALERDRDSNLWVGTDSRGLLRINDKGVASFAPGTFGSHEAITAVFEDREGDLWIGRADGIERLRDSPFMTYSLEEGLPTDGSNPVFVDSENRVWFPSHGGGLWWLKDGQHGRVKLAGLDNDVVYSIAGKDGELWLGRQRGGLTRLQITNATTKARTYTQADGLVQNSVYSVYQDREGTVWAGTLSGGVSRLRDGKFTTYTASDGLASNTVASMVEAVDGTMWFATPVGLSAFSNGKWRTYTGADGLPSVNVNCLFQDSAATLWAGTAAGLAFSTGKSFQRPPAVPASLREQIFGIVEDRFGWLWIATSSHVLRVRRDRLAQGTLSQGDIREYGLADGLRGGEGVKRHRSVVTDSRGRIWFSLNRGISVVDPGRLSKRSVECITHVQTISADGVPIDLRGPVRIPGGSQRVAFGYVGLRLSTPERVRFRYKLEGFDRDWSDPLATREAVYTNLGPKSYRFRVVASTPDGAWDGKEAVADFEILPAYWQTTSFQLAILLAGALAVVLLYRFRVRSIANQLNLLFEERLAERTRIAQELHDTLLQGFLSASMQLHIATDNLPENSPSKPALNRILQLMGQVIDEGRNAVRGLRLSPNTSHDLAQAFSGIQEELGIEQALDFRVIVEGEARPVHPILRDDIYRIGREALANAFRHSRAKSIEIELGYAPSEFRLVVRDNGCGIDPGVLESGRDGHWGLPGMRERAERIGGQLHVWSGADAGTEVQLSIPGNIAFLDHQPSRRLKLFTRRNSQLVTKGGRTQASEKVDDE